MPQSQITDQSIGTARKIDSLMKVENIVECSLYRTQTATQKQEQPKEKIFIAHWISISEILPLD